MTTKNDWTFVIEKSNEIYVTGFGVVYPDSFRTTAQADRFIEFMQTVTVIIQQDAIKDYK